MLNSECSASFQGHRYDRYQDKQNFLHVVSPISVQAYLADISGYRLNDTLSKYCVAETQPFRAVEKPHFSFLEFLSLNLLIFSETMVYCSMKGGEYHVSDSEESNSRLDSGTV